MIYFTSDLHFGHENILIYANRNFSNIEDMNLKFIQNWNKIVTNDDDIFILGDFSLSSGKYVNEIISLLNGKKYLIVGNHEEEYIHNVEFDKSNFEWIKDYHELDYKNIKFVLFHYPIAEWNKYFEKGIQLHGHQHNLPEYNLDMKNIGMRRYDVGVDANYYSPVSIDYIYNFFEN